MSTLSPQAAKLKYEYNKKYQDRYWEKKAATRTNQLPTIEANETTTVNRLDCKSDEKYIKALETANKSMRSENRRLINLLHQYQTVIKQSNAVIL